MSSTVIFLDFDDVLSLPVTDGPGAYDVMLAIKDIRSGKNNADDFEDVWRGLFDEAAVANLFTLHDEFDPTYVLSTSWTRFLDLESLLLVFQRTGLAFVAESLHPDWQTEKLPGWTRAQQISNWLSKHPEIKDWVALDDDWSGTGFSSGSSNVISCQVGVGFNNQALKVAWKALQGQSQRCESNDDAGFRQEACGA